MPAGQLLASPFGIAASERAPSVTAVATTESRGSKHSPLAGTGKPDLLASAIVLAIGLMLLYVALRRLLQ
jgi:hypothetical protein